MLVQDVNCSLCTVSEYENQTQDNIIKKQSIENLNILYTQQNKLLITNNQNEILFAITKDISLENIVSGKCLKEIFYQTDINTWTEVIYKSKGEN